MVVRPLGGFFCWLLNDPPAGGEFRNQQSAVALAKEDEDDVPCHPSLKLRVTASLRKAKLLDNLKLESRLGRGCRREDDKEHILAYFFKNLILVQDKRWRCA